MKTGRAFAPVVWTAVAAVVAACYAGATPALTSPPTPPPSIAPAGVTGSTPASPEATCPCPCPTPATAAGQAGDGSPAVPIAAVRLKGLPFFVRATDDSDIRRCAGFVVDATTLVDGLFLSQSQCWDEGAVWWEDATAWETNEMTAAEDRWIELELDGRYILDAAIIQADNNDAYLLSYRDPATGDWMPLWTVPPAYAFGMATRPDPASDTTRQVLPKVVTTEAVRLEAEFGDGMYSVSEVQLFGEPSPD